MTVSREDLDGRVVNNGRGVCVCMCGEVVNVAAGTGQECVVLN